MKKLLRGFVVGFIWTLPLSAFAGEAISSRLEEGLDRYVGAVEDLLGGIGLGPGEYWRLRPGFEFKTAFDSNVHREPPGDLRDEDVIFSFIPSVELSRIGTRFGVITDYEMNYEQYVRNGRLSGFNHRFGTSVWYDGERLKAKVSERFGFLKTYATSEQSERRSIFFNDVYPEVIYQLSDKLSVSYLYENYVFDYRDSLLKESSYVINDFGGRVYYHVTPKVDLYVQGSGILIDYYRSDRFDSQGFGVYVGAIGKMTEKLVVNLQTGAKGREYDDGAINSYYNWVGEGILKYSLTSKLDATLLAKRDIEESVYQNTGWYAVNRIGSGLRYQITYTISAEANGGFQANRYPRETTEGTLTKKRRDYLVVADAKLKWVPIRHLDLSVGYSFRERESNFDNTFDYFDHYVESSISYKL